MANRRLSMNKLRQVLRCHGSGTGAKSISNLTGVARNTVRKYLRRLVELGTGVEELLKLDDIEDSRKDRELAEKDRIIATLTARSERQAELAPIYKQLSDIACKQPPTVNIPYIPAMSNLVPVSYSQPVSFGVAPYANGCGC